MNESEGYIYGEYLPIMCGFTDVGKSRMFDHSPVCNGDRSKPIGGPSCGCLNALRRSVKPITLAKAIEQVKPVPPSTWLPEPPHPRDVYYSKRKRCPNCYGTWTSQTLAGYTFDMSKPDEFRDENKAQCSACGWVGIVHDMKPR
jgi:hypothetical protein